MTHLGLQPAPCLYTARVRNRSAPLLPQADALLPRTPIVPLPPPVGHPPPHRALALRRRGPGHRRGRRILREEPQPEEAGGKPRLQWGMDLGSMAVVSLIP
jgi:hypothetical protein